MEQFLFILIMFFFIGAIFAVDAREKEKAIGKVYRYVQQQGGTGIKITAHHSYNDQMRTFIVLYRDRNATAQRTRCKVGSQIYWTKDPAQVAVPASNSKLQIIDNLSAENQALRTRLSTTSASQSTTLSSKEQIITDLTQHNEQLQAEVERLQQQLLETK